MHAGCIITIDAMGTQTAIATQIYNVKADYVLALKANGLHWTMEVTFNEDACRVRTGHAPQNLALLRRLALNALNREQSLKRSNRPQSNRASIDNNYMLKILAASLSQHDDASLSACQ